MCLGDELDQVLAGAESRIDVEEVLNAVPVVGVQMPALPKDWTQPHGRHAQALEIVELAGDTRQSSALVAIASGRRPAVPAPGLSVGLIGTGICRLRPIE